MLIFRFKGLIGFIFQAKLIIFDFSHSLTSVDIHFIKKSVYIHLIDDINVPAGETVSVGVVI